MNAKRKHRGFTMVEIVIVLVVLGILTLAIAPRFQDVAEEARLNTFRNNCKTVSSALGVYQAGHGGELPANAAELGTCIYGGWAALENNPSGAHYSYARNVFTAEYTDMEGITHSFTFPN